MATSGSVLRVTEGQLVATHLQEIKLALRRRGLWTTAQAIASLALLRLDVDEAVELVSAAQATVVA